MLLLQVKVETEGEHKINNSYQSLYKQMVDIMRGLGIEAVPTVGAPFDPAFHEAIMSEPNSEVCCSSLSLSLSLFFIICLRLNVCL